VTTAAVKKVEAWLKEQPETKNIVSYIGQGAPRFYLGYNPELPDPSFAKIVVMTPSSAARDELKVRAWARIAEGLAPEARVRATQFVFGPPSPWPIAFRVMGPDAGTLRSIAQKVLTVMRADPHMRQVNTDWGERSPSIRFTLDQDRLRLIGLSPNDVAEQLQFLLTGVSTTVVREDIRTVQVMARSGGSERLDPSKLSDLVLQNESGKLVPLSQIGHTEVVQEDPILKRRDRTPTITVQGDIDEQSQPPPVSLEIQQALQPIIAGLPEGYRIEMGGNIEEADKANKALAPVFPVMFILTMIVIIFQVRSFPAMAMVLATAPLGLIGVVPTLLIFHQPFGFNAILGLIGLSGILMRNTLILIEQIKTNKQEGLDDYHAAIEATVQRARPVILTALAAVLAFIPLTTSVFWGSMAYTLIGGTAVGTLLILLFLPALYAIWFRVRRTEGALAAGVAAAPV
jgi:multidrug efflux pump subunit AcrB